MRIFKFLIAALILGLWIWALQYSFPGKKGNLPPIGSFLSPGEGFLGSAEPMNEVFSDLVDHIPLDSEVQVQFDKRLVPHIFANNDQDAFRVLGFLHAKYRLFQMDLIVRSASGRLSEIMGPRLLERDKLQRRKGMPWAAEIAHESWKNSEGYGDLLAYAEGHNAYLAELKDKDLPIEFKLLNYKPESWNPYKTALLLKSMAQTLCARNHDISATNTQLAIGEQLFKELYPDQMSKMSPIIPKTVEYPFVPVDPKGRKGSSVIDDFISHKPLPNPPSNIGSNNWAVGGAKTKSGYPILANDPHLSLTLPSIWYEAHIVTPETRVYGVTLTGYPGVIIGFNENIAWGMTNVGHDVTDWYDIQWTNDSKEEYFLDGQQVKIDQRIEEIGVRGHESILDTVKYTHWGPIVFESTEGNGQDLAMRWIAHDPPDPMEVLTFLRVNQAEDFDDFSKAVQTHSSPAQNMVFASKEGNIAMRVQGKFPLKQKDQGKFVSNGNNSENGWSGFIPTGHTPAMLNPERGYVSSANQKSTDSNYPYYYNARFEQFRGRHLNSRLDEMNEIDTDDIRLLQYDNYNLEASEFIPVILDLLNRENLSGEALEWIKKLENWNYHYEAESAEPTIFEIWLKHLKKLTWDEMEGVSMISPQNWKLRDLLADEPAHEIFDNQKTPEIEVAANIVREAWDKTLSQVSEMSSADLHWRTYNKLVIPHLSRIPSFGNYTTRMGGSSSSLNAMRGGFGPSWRMVVEMGPEPAGFGVIPGGQSGNPGSPFFETGIEKWSQGKLFKLNFPRNPQELESTLFVHNFKPGKS
ncbi:MAG: penicillin acylase family protein [Saprospiraceae bacterium]|nr:penicillin acylase family protein [Saprospiraceae bacterium]